MKELREKLLKQVRISIGGGMDYEIDPYACQESVVDDLLKDYHIIPKNLPIVDRVRAVGGDSIISIETLWEGDDCVCIQNELWDKAVEICQSLSDYADIKTKIDEYVMTDRKVCGNCFYWMKSSLCPCERNVNGRQIGPSMSGVACNKFQLNDITKKLKKERLSKIKEHSYYKHLPQELKSLIEQQGIPKEGK